MLSWTGISILPEPSSDIHAWREEYHVRVHGEGVSAHGSQGTDSSFHVVVVAAFPDLAVIATTPGYVHTNSLHPCS